MLNDALIISIIIPYVDNTFNLQLYQVHSIPMVNTMLHKTLTIQMINTYFTTSHNEQLHLQYYSNITILQGTLWNVLYWKYTIVLYQEDYILYKEVQITPQPYISMMIVLFSRAALLQLALLPKHYST